MRICDTIEEAIKSYHDLNGQIIEEIAEPSALDFMRYVSQNRPFVVRNGCLDWPAVRQWNCENLSFALRDARITVAVTPHGNADSAVKNTTDDITYFTKPCEVEESFQEFIHYIRRQEKAGVTKQVIRYAQTQNDNLRGEYQTLFKDVAKDIPWARVALGRGPEAINLWIGNSKSTTALHKDNYENIYCQVIGKKHFVLMPPIEMACTNEQMLPPATYAPTSGDLGHLSVVPDVGQNAVPCARWNPDEPAVNRNRFSYLSRPLRVDLSPGDMLYLPALWYHQVSQSVGDEDICVAVNYWYDMDFGGSFYISNAFMRDMVLLALESPDARDDSS